MQKMINNEILRTILLQTIDEKEHIYLNSKIIDSWESEDDYSIIFENMRPNCFLYMIDKEQVKKHIRLEKLKNIIN